jgi:hypothetical protein
MLPLPGNKYTDWCTAPALRIIDREARAGFGPQGSPKAPAASRNVSGSFCGKARESLNERSGVGNLKFCELPHAFWRNERRHERAQPWRNQVEVASCAIDVLSHE